MAHSRLQMCRAAGAVLVVVLGAGLGGCAPQPAAVQVTAPRAVAPAPAEALSQDALQTFMFGPPPRTTIDPFVRCRVNCPPAQAGAQAGTQAGAAALRSR